MSISNMGDQPTSIPLQPPAIQPKGVQSASHATRQRPPSGRIKIQLDPDGMKIKQKRNFFQSNS